MNSATVPADTMSSSSSGPSAVDVITYIGMPLAVLGVLPIIYNTIVTLITLAKVKRLLKKSRLAGITRGDVINNVIEVELPRFTLDREEHSDEYWSTYPYPSLVPGGSWTIFNWKLHTVGIKTQRITYADELRQPQADIGFEELISYLLDLGAVPNAAGFRMLRTSGLWVPTGTPLLLSPDLHEAALKIAPLDDSDGNLSLAVRWSRVWKMRDKQSLPPYWIRLSTPDAEQSKLDVQNCPPKVDDEKSQLAEVEPVCATDSVSEESKKPLDISEAPADEATVINRVESIRCEIRIDGIFAAVPESLGDSSFEHIDISHLQIQRMNTSTGGIWFASAATALGASSQTVLWNYHIPEEILIFARKETVPCGILVLLGSVDESSTPEWATKYDDRREDSERQMRRLTESTQAMMRERQLAPDQRIAAERERQQKSFNEFVEDQRRTARQREQRAETRTHEALQSPKWDSKLVGQHNLTWLKEKGHIAQVCDVKGAVEVLLWKMLKDVAFARDLTQMLDSWKAWVDNGGMKKVDYQGLQEKQVIFAYASLILSVIRDSVTAVDGSLAMDLQESVRIWKRVRLG
jgi:hypothetical protein